MTSSKSLYSIQKTTPNLLSQNTPHSPLHVHVEEALTTFFQQAEGVPVNELYNMVLSTVEPALFKVIFKFCKTQDQAAKMLGISRGTLRKKLKYYHFIP